MHLARSQLRPDLAGELPVPADFCPLARLQWARNHSPPGHADEVWRTARGTPLQALAAKVVDNIFLVALSNVDAQRNANTLLLKERSWFDIPVIYADQRRAIIAIEKGMSGQKAIDAAIAAWEASPGGPVAQQPSSHGDDEASTCVARVAMSTQ